MIKRTIYKKVVNMLGNWPIVLITGPRQVGKSTLCFELVKEYGYDYVSLDDLRNREAALNDPELFIALRKKPLIIDEIQYVPKLFDVIESIVNKAKFDGLNNSGMFILTGSQSFDLMKNVTESMAGRVGIIDMLPLSQSEINNVEESPFKLDLEYINERTKSYQIDALDIFNNIVRGFYPALYDKPNLETEEFYSSYVRTYIERDVSQIINVKDKLLFQQFMEVLSSLTGQELIYDNLAKTLGVAVNTIRSWVGILATSGIIKKIETYNEFSNIKRVVKRPKIYFTDTGLACYLARLSNVDVLKNSIFSGRFVETYMVNEIIKSYYNNGKQADFYYYRDKDLNEVDLIVLTDGKLNLIECKSGINFDVSDFSGIKILLKKVTREVEAKVIICNTPSIYSLGDGLLVLPITSI